jgi:S1-C subfamily serine protease
MTLRTRVALVTALVTVLAGCGGETPAPHAPPSSTPASALGADAGAPDPKPAPPGGALRRSDVSRAVAAGLGAFLARIALDDQPARVSGRFHGFRVVALRGDPAFWRDVDLRAGDVVTRVNGMPIEHPEEALEVFRSLDVASELRVDLERDGAPRDLRFSILDDVPVAKPDAGAARR